jgi:hypothetical protein
LNSQLNKPKIFVTQPNTTRTGLQQTGIQQTQKTATAKSASTGYSNADTFGSSGFQSTMAKDLSLINGGSTMSKSPDDIIATAEVNALSNPAQAASLLKNGIKDPTTGRPLAGPIDPNSDLGKLLTKVANNQPVSPSDLESAAGIVKDRALVSKSVASGLDNTMQSITSQYNQMEQTADTSAGDDDDDS